MTSEKEVYDYIVKIIPFNVTYLPLTTSAEHKDPI